MQNFLKGGSATKTCTKFLGVFQIVYIRLGSLEMILSCFFKSLSGSFVNFLTGLLLWQMACVSNSKINSMTHVSIHWLFVTSLMSLKFISLSLLLIFNCHSHACQYIPYLIIHYWSILQSKRVNLWDRDNLRTKDKRLLPKVSFVRRLNCM